MHLQERRQEKKTDRQKASRWTARDGKTDGTTVIIRTTEQNIYYFNYNYKEIHSEELRHSIT